MNNKVLSTLGNIIEKDVDSLKKIIIYPEDNNSYNVYGMYTVVKNKSGSYTVNTIGTHTEKNFYKLKHAITWCNFDKRKLYKKAERIKDLDQLIWSMDTEIQIHLALIKSTKNEEAKIIYLSKLTENRSKKRQFNVEITNYINDFNRYQNELFNRKPIY